MEQRQSPVLLHIVSRSAVASSANSDFLFCHCENYRGLKSERLILKTDNHTLIAHRKCSNSTSACLLQSTPNSIVLIIATNTNGCQTMLQETYCTMRIGSETSLFSNVQQPTRPLYLLCSNVHGVNARLAVHDDAMNSLHHGDNRLFHGRSTGRRPLLDVSQLQPQRPQPPGEALC